MIGPGGDGGAKRRSKTHTRTRRSETHTLLPPRMAWGSKGRAVAVWQLFLKVVLGQAAADLVIDGDFGNVMVRCVKALQRMLNLDETGSLDEMVMSNAIADRFGADPWIIPATALNPATRYFGRGNERRFKHWGKARSERGLAFPPWFNAHSDGRAAVLMKVVLTALRRGSGLCFNPRYGDLAIQSVADFQALVGLEADGHFGQDTRKAILDRTGVDLNALPLSPFMATTEVFDGKNEIGRRWPPIRRGKKKPRVRKQQRGEKSNAAGMSWDEIKVGPLPEDPDVEERPSRSSRLADKIIHGTD